MYIGEASPEEYYLLGQEATQSCRSSREFFRNIAELIYGYTASLPEDRHVQGHVLKTVKSNKGSLLLKNGIFWDVTPCGSCKNRRFGGT
jgi:hypothetical protein